MSLSRLFTIITICCFVVTLLPLASAAGGPDFSALNREIRMDGDGWTAGETGVPELLWKQYQAGNHNWRNPDIGTIETEPSG